MRNRNEQIYTVEDRDLVEQGAQRAKEARRLRREEIKEDIKCVLYVGGFGASVLAFGCGTTTEVRVAGVIGALTLGLGPRAAREVTGFVKSVKEGIDDRRNQARS